MLRLFLSLYLAICLGLVVINLSSSFLYEHLQTQLYQDKDHELNNLAQLAQAFNTLPKPQLQQIQQTLPYPSKLITLSDLGLLPDQKQQILAGKVLTLFDQEQNIHLYSQTQLFGILHIGPIPQINSPQQLATGIIFLSYLSLALFVLAWSRPLWRDLTQLKTMAEHIKSGTFKTNNSVNKQSVIYPVITSFNLMVQKIDQLLSSQKQMTHAISHDIKTPLARLKFSLAIVKSQPELLEKTTNDMLIDVEEIDNLTSELLTYARLEHQQTVNLEHVNLTQLVQNMAEKLSRNSEIILTVKCDPSSVFHCDGHLIERCLQNLITNSFKYAKTQVLLSVNIVEKQLLITVEDDGPGIKVQDRELVINPFKRLADDTNQSTSGFGLGLAIVNKIVIWHSGNLHITKGKLGGALIEICIPK